MDIPFRIECIFARLGRVRLTRPLYMDLKIGMKLTTDGKEELILGIAYLDKWVWQSKQVSFDKGSSAQNRDSNLLGPHNGSCAGLVVGSPNFLVV